MGGESPVTPKDEIACENLESREKTWAKFMSNNLSVN